MGQQSSQEDQNMLELFDDSVKIPQKTKQVMTESRLGFVYIGSGRWKEYQISKYSQHVKEWKVRKGLAVDSNCQQNILHQIVNIRFQFMIELSLRENNIESIEILPRIYMPKIQKIYLCQNYISQVRSLRKLSAPHLVYLSLSGNDTIDTSHFFCLNSRNLQDVYMHLRNEQKWNKYNLIDVNNLAKLQSVVFNKEWLGRSINKMKKICPKMIQNQKSIQDIIQVPIQQDPHNNCSAMKLIAMPQL